MVNGVLQVNFPKMAPSNVSSTRRLDISDQPVITPIGKQSGRRNA